MSYFGISFELPSGVKRFRAILLVVVVALTACNRSKATPGEFTANENDVVSAYVADVFANHKNQLQASKIVILKTTSSGEDTLLPDENGRPIPWEKTADSLLRRAPSLQKTTVDAFRNANARQAILRPSFTPPVSYEIIDSAQLESAFKRNGGDWPAYYKQYPGSQGYATFSRVGFSADGTQALFFISNRCGALCGGGWYVVMEEQNGRWALLQEIHMWVS